MKKLPIGIQTFKKMREQGYVYVDKTEHIYKLAQDDNSIFLSRPRRFGKSLLLETFKELFLGSENLFKGLWIHDKWDWSQTYPVIHLSFDAADYQNMGLGDAISFELKEIAKTYTIELVTGTYKKQFEELLKKLFEKHGKVVLLIDEYDKPIIDYLESNDLPQAKENQKIMKTFYSVLKKAEPHLRFFLITGVSNFSKTFEELDHLYDLTLDKSYASIVGYTQEELEFYFEEHIQSVLKNNELTREKLLENMRIWYGGFSWNGKTQVYNPYSILNFLIKETLQNFGFTTDIPKLIEDSRLYDFKNTEVNALFLERNNIENLNLIPLLFQTGYLTIKSFDRLTEDLVLDYPNKEVRESMYSFMIDGLARNERREVGEYYK
jgi:GTPase SAR1 family protein